MYAIYGALFPVQYMEQYQLFLSSYQEDTRLKGPLRNMVTWYKKHLAGWQATHTEWELVKKGY